MSVAGVGEAVISAQNASCVGKTFCLSIGQKGRYRLYDVHVEGVSNGSLLVHVVRLSPDVQTIGRGVIPGYSLPIREGTRFCNYLRIYRTGAGQDFSIALPNDRVVELEEIGSD